MAYWNVPQRDVIARAITIIEGTNTTTAGPSGGLPAYMLQVSTVGRELLEK
jgi:hypothetical protein